MKKPNAAVMAGISAHQPAKPTKDALKNLREQVRAAADLELEISDLEEKLFQKKQKLNEIKSETLPSLFEDVGVDTIGVEPLGNAPGFDAELKPYYHATLKPENMAEAFRKFRWLSPMQKHTFKVEFGRGEAAQAKKFLVALKKQRLDYSNSVGVPWNTLTAEIRRRHEDGEPLSPGDLQILGATVGKVVQLKKRK